jgi:hypothetical protein
MEAWLRRSQHVLILSIWNMVSIVCWLTSLPKPISSWYRTDSGAPAARRQWLVVVKQPVTIDAHLSATRQREEGIAEIQRYALAPFWQFQEEGDSGVHDLAMATAGHLAAGTPVETSASHEQPGRKWIESATVRVVNTGGLA